MIVFRDVAGMKCNVIQGPRISLTLHPGYKLRTSTIAAK